MPRSFSRWSRNAPITALLQVPWVAKCEVELEQGRFWLELVEGVSGYLAVTSRR
jgi:hypothetical protein